MDLASISSEFDREIHSIDQKLFDLTELSVSRALSKLYELFTKNEGIFKLVSTS